MKLEVLMTSALWHIQTIEVTKEENSLLRTFTREELADWLMNDDRFDNGRAAHDKGYRALSCNVPHEKDYRAVILNN